MFKKVNDFLRETKAELSRVTWPSREAIIGGTAAVILVSGIFVAFMWVVDLLLTRGLALLIK